MEIIYSPSYQSFNLIFYFKYVKKQEILIISNNNELIKICSKLGIKNIKFFEKYKKFESLLHKKKKIEEFYERHISKDDNIWIVHNNHDTLGYILALKHSLKKLNVFFLDFDPIFHRINFIYLIKFFIKKPKVTIYKIYDYLVLKYLFKLSISWGSIYSDGNMTFVLDEENRIKNNFLKPKLKADEIRKKVYSNSDIKYLKKNNLSIYFGNTIPFHHAYLDNEYFNDTIKQLNNKIKNFNYKPHPNVQNFIPKFFPNNKILDNKLPFILLFNSCNLVISISSAVLVDVLVNEKIKSISMIEMLKWKSLKVKEDLKKYLFDLMKKRNLQGVHFPKNIKELLSIIND